MFALANLEGAVLLKLKNIGKIYDSNDIFTIGIRGINLEFDYNEFVTIEGESGSGKSTLLNVIGANDTYEEGELYINGEETSHYSETEWEKYREKNIATIFQDFNIIENLTVLENVELALLRLDDKKERRKRAKELIDRVGLTKQINQRGSKLSGGEKQRTVIARALAKDAPIILADEPTGNLDVKASKEVAALLKEVSKDNGYEYLNDFTVNVSVNGTTTAPSAEDIATYYMDAATVSYAYSSGENEGEDFDFSAPITENMVIRVMWATPGAVYDQMSNGTWYFKEFDRQGGTMNSVYTYPCLSFLSEVTYENQEIQVEAVSYQYLYEHTGTYKILFADGIKMIRGFYGTTTCPVQVIDLPSTLKILDGAFWFLPDLQGIELPDGLEIIIDTGNLSHR